jgi:hypothetical protein
MQRLDLFVLAMHFISHTAHPRIHVHYRTFDQANRGTGTPVGGRIVMCLRTQGCCAASHLDSIANVRRLLGFGLSFGTSGSQAGRFGQL